MSVLCGHVYCLHLPIAAKDKLLVPAYVQQDGKVRFFVINSERTQYIINNHNLASHVLEINVLKNQQFLNYDSWLSCHEVVGGLGVDEVCAQPNSYRGPLDHETITAVRNLITDSRLYSPVQIQCILDQWPA